MIMLGVVQVASRCLQILADEGNQIRTAHKSVAYASRKSLQH